MSLILELLAVLLIFPPSRSETRGIRRAWKWLLGVTLAVGAAMLAWSVATGYGG